MKVYDKTFDVCRKEDGSYTFSMKLSDDHIIIKTVPQNDLHRLKNLLDDILREI